MTLFQKIEKLCKKEGITLSGLEHELGFSNGSIGKMKKTTPSAKRLQAIADFFGVSVDYLLSEKPDTLPTGVQIIAQPMYYTDPEAAAKAQELFNDPKYRVLFDAAPGSTAEDLQMAADLLLRLKQTRRD